METESRQPIFEGSRIVRYMNSPQWERGSSTAFVFAPNHYHRLDETAAWIEFDSKIRSVKYHLGKFVEHRNRNKDAEGVVPEGGWAATTYPQGNDSIVRCSDGSISTNGWRQKIETDMAISGLVALKNILDLLYENGKNVVGIAGSLTIWSLLMSASYVVHSYHFSSYSDNGAFVTFCAAGYYTASSTCQLFHVGMRALAINRCQRIVASLHYRVIADSINQQDVESLHHYWFRALNWYRVEDRPGRRQYEEPFGCYVDRFVTSSEYVIPSDDE